MKSIGEAYVALKARVDELERDLAAEREARDEVECKYHEVVRDHNALLARAEQAEREQEEVNEQSVIINRLHDEERTARERAEADNAALLGHLRAIIEDARRKGYGITPDGEALIVADHPGAALLERLRALEGVLEACAAYIDWYGVQHDEGCPEDPSCKCPLLVAINDAIAKADALRG